MIAEALRAAALQIGAGDARALLAHVLGIAPDRLTLHLRDSMPDAALAALEAAVAARLAHQPVAQITGRRQFWRHEFIVTRDTLDPRPETEVLVEQALSRPFAQMLDLGTGTGCILLSCLADRPQARGLGIDLSLAALDVAARNAAALGLTDRATLRQSDWFSAVQGEFDLIVANPPYIAEDEMADLAPDVLNWEPHLALTPGGDGLAAYRVIAAGAPLVSGGRLLLEIGPTQGAAVAAMLVQHGFDAVRILPDLDGRDRVICGEKP